MADTFLSTQILVFRTSLQSKDDCQRLASFFDPNPQIISWNVDLEDSDKVLRIESAHLQAEDIIQYVTNAGFFCEELQD